MAEETDQRLTIKDERGKAIAVFKVDEIDSLHQQDEATVRQLAPLPLEVLEKLHGLRELVVGVIGSTGTASVLAKLGNRLSRLAAVVPPEPLVE